MQDRKLQKEKRTGKWGVVRPRGGARDWGPLLPRGVFPTKHCSTLQASVSAARAPTRQVRVLAGGGPRRSPAYQVRVLAGGAVLFGLCSSGLFVGGRQGGTSFSSVPAEGA